MSGVHTIGINGTPANNGDPISVNGTIIGTVGSNASGAQSFSFNSAATNASLNEFMQSLTYDFTGILPPTSVDVFWEFKDAGNLSDNGTTTVNFTPNQTPIVDLNGPGAGEDLSLTYTENDGSTSIAPNASITDFGENDIIVLNLDAAGFASISNSELVFGGASITGGVAASGTIALGGSTIAYNYNGGEELSLIHI